MMIARRASKAFATHLPNRALKTDGGAMVCALRALLLDAAAAERKRYMVAQMVISIKHTLLNCNSD